MKKNVTELDLLIEQRERQEKYFKNYLKYAKIIKKETQKLLKEVKVYIFGSILKKDEVPRDIDVLIISPKLKTTLEKGKIRLKLWQMLGSSNPFEIHLINPEEYRNWYRYFIKKKIEIK